MRMKRYCECNAGWRFFSIALLLALTAGVAPGQTSPSLFDDRQIQDVRLEVDPVVWETLRRDYLLDTYYPAQFTWNGHTVPNVGIRSRGSGSRSPEKPNLKIAFDKYEDNQQFAGLASIVLKANNQDASLLREALAMQLFRMMGLPAPSEAFARLYVNGEFFGAYVLVEAIDEAFLLRNFGEDTGYLYDWEANRTEKGYRFDYLGPNPSNYSPIMWDPSNHKKDPDPAVIEAMVRTINQSSDADFQKEVSRYVDLKQFMAYIAIENYVGNWDGFLGDAFGMNNFNSYRFAGTTVFHFLPWDKDLSFDLDYYAIMAGVQENVLSRRAMQIPELRNLYLEILNKAAQVAGGPGGWLEGEFDRLYALIGDMARADPHKQCAPGGVVVSCGAADFEEGAASVRRFIQFRQPFVLSEVAGAGYRAPAAAPKIFASGVVNAAANSTWLAPGSLITIYGEGLSVTTDQASQYPPATNLAGVVVLVNGARAPLLYVSPGQVNVQVPWDTTPGPAAFTVFLDGLPGNTITAEIGDFAPGIFLVAHAADGVPVSPEQPAMAGEALLIYATGLGKYATGLGALNSDQSERDATETPAVEVGDVPAIVDLAEPPPGSVGLVRLSIQLPQGVPAGSSVPLTVTVGGLTASISLSVR